MSVTTTVDENIQTAKDHISSAIKELLNTVDEDTWGHHDMSDEYLETIHDSILKLSLIKRKL